MNNLLKHYHTKLIDLAYFMIDWMIILIDMADSYSGQKARPKSAVGFRYSQHQNMRLNNNESLNTIHNEINKTFRGQNKLFKSIKQLTSSRVNNHYQNRINRLCVQFSICPNPSRQRRISDQVDVEFIAKKFVRNKSKQRQKQSEREFLRRSVGAISRRFIRQQPEQFFKFDRQTLNSMQKKEKQQGKGKRKEHPYLLLYDKLQDQVIANLNDTNCLGLGEEGSYPCLQEPDDWQRQTKHIKQISGLMQSVRVEGIKRRERNKYSANTDSFYIT